MPKCFVVPGITGSAIFYALPSNDLLWVDYTRLALGQVGALRLAPNGSDPGQPDGRLMRAEYPLPAYYDSCIAALIRDLDSHGYAVIGWGYDWRKKNREAGALLADEIRATVLPSDPCSIVGHSQGGIVARAAWANLLATGEEGRIRRIVTLGTPHQGSYAIVAMFSLDNDNLSQIAWITSLVSGIVIPPFGITGPRRWTLEELCVLAATWPATYELMPLLQSPSAATDPNRAALFVPGNWPAGRELSTAHLTYARDDFQVWLRSAASMPPAHVLTTVAGIGLQTFATLNYPQDLGDSSALGFGQDGDGRVTMQSALVPISSAYSIVCRHTDLPGETAVSGDLAQWVLEVRTPPTPVPPIVAIPGQLHPGLAGPPLPSPLGSSQQVRCRQRPRL